MINQQRRRKLLAEHDRANWIAVLLFLDRHLYPDAIIRPNTAEMSVMQLKTHTKQLLKKAYAKKAVLDEAIRAAELEFLADGKTEDWNSL